MRHYCELHCMWFNVTTVWCVIEIVGNVWLISTSFQWQTINDLCVKLCMFWKVKCIMCWFTVCLAQVCQHVMFADVLVCTFMCSDHISMIMSGDISFQDRAYVAASGQVMFLSSQDQKCAVPRIFWYQIISAKWPVGEVTVAPKWPMWRDDHIAENVHCKVGNK